MTRLWLVMLLALPVAGCSDQPDCLPTKLDVSPIDVPDVTSPISLSARLTRDGHPVVGASVGLAFAIKSELGGSGGMPQYVRTDADGVAKREQPAGVAGVGLAGDRVEGYEAYFQPLTTADGFTDHCWSKVSAPITCAGVACPPTPKP
ncbi:hypothetical protein Lesp02_24910 [Lentzea sp. NBRC 105346]|uniref:hypothetical protein n=1 Tax=Lentzea sp. NBRC 105346 TaxID=3032205 RepID=UPI002554BFFD|nr:hypothetical protein [Lentzea sp. NBRC 105346]GLZ30302.1 hypothetical protein Lesp02_24910 [Lentzea sp. NBRC 105346]